MSTPAPTPKAANRRNLTSSIESESLTVSLTFYFEEPPVTVPDFLVGLRGRNPSVHAFSRQLHVDEADYRKRSTEVCDFLEEFCATFAQNVNAQWLLENRCELRAYITPHPGKQNGGVRLANSTLAALAEVGAFIELEVI